MDQTQYPSVSDAVATARFTVRKEVLKVIREQAGLSQTTMAQLIGVSRPAYANWERGAHRPALRHRARLMAVLAEINTELNIIDT